MGLHALQRLLQLLQEPPRPLRPALAATPAALSTLSLLLLLSPLLLLSGSMHALQNLPPHPLQQPPSALAAPQLEQQGGERQRTCCCCWLLVLLLLAGTWDGLLLLAACMAAVANGESEAVAGASSDTAALPLLMPLSLAKRLKTFMLLLCLTAKSLKNEAPAAPAVSSAVGEPGRVTIGDETGVNMYSLPDIASAEVCPSVLNIKTDEAVLHTQLSAKLLCFPACSTDTKIKLLLCSAAA
jgi:hypothetical protein